MLVKFYVTSKRIVTTSIKITFLRGITVDSRPLYERFILSGKPQLLYSVEDFFFPLVTQAPFSTAVTE